MFQKLGPQNAADVSVAGALAIERRGWSFSGLVAQKFVVEANVHGMGVED